MFKIAILSYYSGGVDRGVETFVQEIGTRLAKKHRVTIFQSGNPTPFQKYKSIQIKIPVKTPKSKKGFLGKIYMDTTSFRILFFSLLASRKFMSEKYDCVFVMNGGWQTAIYRLLSKISNCKMIIPGEAGIGAEDAYNILFRPDAFIALTSAQKNWAQKLQGEVRIEQIPNGVDLSRFNPKVSEKNVGLKKPIVICTAALDFHKRVDLTIKAVAKTNNLSLLVLGDGEARGQIDSLGKRFLQNRFKRFVVPYDQMPLYYKAGKIFTLASQTEAFGTAYIEAMACNLPVVTTSDDTRAEIVGDAGILTDVTNIEKYAKDLEIAAKTNYKNKPYAQALNFSWNKIAQKYLSLIENLSNPKNL